jgi:hypothetical protein
MGCLQTKHARRSPHLLDTREAVALAAETSCEKVDLPNFVNIATGTPRENWIPSFIRKRNRWIAFRYTATSSCSHPCVNVVDFRRINSAG